METKSQPESFREAETSNDKKPGWTARMRGAVGKRLARSLSRSLPGYVRLDIGDPLTYAELLQPADLILVEGDTRFSKIIKYLTQSTWSHIAMYVGPEEGEVHEGDPLHRPVLIEADVIDGVIRSPLSKYSNFNTRILRARGLEAEEVAEVCQYMRDRCGHQYDMKHIGDLLKYLTPKPRFLSRNRRHRLEMGSGDPTRAICSSIIAQAFQSIGYPILPERGAACSIDGEGNPDALCFRHYSNFSPRDFDLSPYFEIIKPTLINFDFRKWPGKVVAGEKKKLGPSESG